MIRHINLLTQIRVTNYLESDRTSLHLHINVSIPHLHRLARDGKFPKPIQDRQRTAVAWLEKLMCEEWISECIRKHHAGGKYAR